MAEVLKVHEKQNKRRTTQNTNENAEKLLEEQSSINFSIAIL